MTHSTEKNAPRIYTNEQRRAAMAALLSGDSQESVAAKVDVHPGTLSVWWNDAKRGQGSCSSIYKDLAGRVIVDLSKLKIIDILHRYVVGEVLALRDYDPDNVREKLATVLYELDAADEGVVTLSRQQSDALRRLIVKRVTDAPEMVIDHHMGRMAMAALLLEG